MALTLKSLSPFGAEAQGVNLWEQLSDAQVKIMQDAWSQSGLLIFRRQALAEGELVRFSAVFGATESIVRADWASAAFPQVIQISNMKDSSGRSIGGLGAGELDWHTDQSYVVAPATGSVLYMVEMPANAPATYWANLQLAYAALDADTRARCEGVDVVYDYLARQSTYDDEPQMSAELRRNTPIVTHPLVNTHPVTGARSLYLDPTTAVGILGWDEALGRAFLDELRAHVTQPQFVYTHQWQIGDVVMWDNGVLMHRRDAFDATGNRLLKRTTLKLSAAQHIVPSGTELLEA
jgi:taurine dioxygenase